MVLKSSGCRPYFSCKNRLYTSLLSVHLPSFLSFTSSLLFTYLFSSLHLSPPLFTYLLLSSISSSPLLSPMSSLSPLLSSSLLFPQNLLMSTPPTHLHQPMARKRLSLSTQQAQSPPGPIFPVTMTTPTSMMGGVPLTGGGTPVQSGQVGGVPTTPQGTPSKSWGAHEGQCCIYLFYIFISRYENFKYVLFVSLDFFISCPLV